MIVARFLYLPLLFLLFFLLSSLSVFAHGGVSDDDSSGVSVERLQECVSLERDRDVCYASLCADDATWLCADSILDVSVPTVGPDTAMLILHDIMKSPVFSISSDGHLLSHTIGQSLARNLGSTGEYFLRCPSGFNDGCFHGFFEVVILESETPVDTVEDICGSMPNDATPKERSYCYHGAGHVFMMHESHDLDAAIALCLQIHGDWSESCLQGVFMENAGDREWELKKKNFREDEPLYPCTVVADRFKPECYINHHGYLVRHYSESWDSLADVCRGAGDFKHYCFGGLGLMLGSEYWIDVVSDDFSINEKSHTEKAVFLCERFPDEHIFDCYSHLVPSFLNFDVDDLTRVSHLCSSASEMYRRFCFEQVGSYLRNLVSTDAQRIVACDTVPSRFRDVCIGVSSDDAEVVTESPSTSFFDRLKNPFVLLFQPFRTLLTSFVFSFPLTAFSHSDSDTDVDSSGDTASDTASSESAAFAGEDRDYSFLSRSLTFLQSFLGWVSGLFHFQSSADRAVPLHVLTPEDDSDLLLHDSVFMDEALQTYTLRSLTASLSRLGMSGGFDCHNRAHEMGRRAYELLGNDAFKNCGVECHSGCRHGATEAFFAKNGASDLGASIGMLCGEERSVFDLHQCIHGVGHGLMAWFDYHLYDALEACDLIDQEFHRNSCYSGVFMENIVGGIARNDAVASGSGHFTDYLTDDPHYPCNSVANVYKGQCYWLQTDRMLQLRGIDAISGLCAGAPEAFQFQCFHSMGRTVSSFYGRDSERSYSLCSTIPNIENRNTCLEGALSDSFWDATQSGYAVKLCEMAVGSSFERRCYEQLIIRASEVLLRDSIADFCKTLPSLYRTQCLDQETPQAQPLSAAEHVSAQSDAEQVDVAVVRYVDGAYVPDRVHISVGGKVTWVNEDQAFWPASNLHPTHAAYPGSDIKQCGGEREDFLFDACRTLDFGSEYSFFFHEVGEWRYHDHINPVATGVVVVSEK